jgi:hypothetical protein
MRTLHRYSLHGHAISAGAHALVGMFASQVHAGLYRRSPAGTPAYQIEGAKMSHAQ